MPRPRPHAAALAALLALTAVGAPALAQRDFSKVEIRTTTVAPGLYLLEGAGGNLALLVGADGPILIDDQFAPLHEKIKAAVAAVSPRPVRFILNTHYHGDHVGGNEDFGKEGVVIVAHDNVRRRMSVEQFNALFDRTTPPYPGPALPVVTFNDSAAFHLNGQTVTCFHVPPAHTDGDVVVWFRDANVVHVGDLLFNGTYPVIDVSSGGSIAGMIAADDRILAAIGPDTKIIPGHGPLATRADLQAFRDMLQTALDRVAALMRQGRTLEQIQAAKPLADLDTRWGQGSMKQDRFLQAIVWSLDPARPPAKP